MKLTWLQHVASCYNLIPRPFIGSVISLAAPITCLHYQTLLFCYRSSALPETCGWSCGSCNNTMCISCFSCSGVAVPSQLNYSTRILLLRGTECFCHTGKPCFVLLGNWKVMYCTFLLRAQLTPLFATLLSCLVWNYKQGSNNSWSFLLFNLPPWG